MLSLDRPRAFLYHEFLSEEECDHLVKVAEGGLMQSGVVDAETGGSTVSEIRTSKGAFVARALDPIVAGIERRIAEWTQLPEEHGEAIQARAAARSVRTFDSAGR